MRKVELRGCPIVFYLFTIGLCVHVNHNHKLQYANSGKVILEWKAEIQQPRADGMEVKTAQFIYGMNNLCQNISRTGSSVVDVPPTREIESRKILVTFYRTASNITVALPNLVVSMGARSSLDRQFAPLSEPNSHRTHTEHVQDERCFFGQKQTCNCNAKATLRHVDHQNR
jgi:hypothetical protein